MLGSAEKLALELVAVVGVGAVLVALSNTGLYGVAIGTEVVALVYVVFTLKPDPGVASGFLSKYLG